MDLSKIKQKFSYKAFGIGGETELEIEMPERSELKRGTRGVDYNQLRKFLKKGDWRAANKETWEVMYRVAAVAQLNDEYILNFPCEDLQQINELWEHYSKGKFGFSVQKKIYENLRGFKTSKSHYSLWGEFNVRVGWAIRDEKWYSVSVYDSDLIFDLKNAPQGHLPCWFKTNDGAEMTYFLFYAERKYNEPGLFFRAKTCNL
jgi:hypothetical protein